MLYLYMKVKVMFEHVTCVYIYGKYTRSSRPQVVVFMVGSESKRVVVISALEEFSPTAMLFRLDNFSD